jgi:hypothetical protein
MAIAAKKEILILFKSTYLCEKEGQTTKNAVSIFGNSEGI